MQLENRWPILATAYSTFRLETPTLPSLEADLWRYPIHVTACLGMEEQLGVEVITRRHLQYDLGLPRDGEEVEISGKNPVFFSREILGRKSRFVVQVRDGVVEGLVDPRVLGGKVALDTLEHL
jgi:hypothetical protein